MTDLHRAFLNPLVQPVPLSAVLGTLMHEMQRGALVFVVSRTGAAWHMQYRGSEWYRWCVSGGCISKYHTAQQAVDALAQIVAPGVVRVGARRSLHARRNVSSLVPDVATRQWLGSQIDYNA